MKDPPVTTVYSAYLTEPPAGICLYLFFLFSWKFSLFDANDKSIAQTTWRSDLTVRLPLLCEITVTVPNL